MNHQTDPLERDLTAWFEDTAVPRIPDYVDDILERTAHVRQRPRWSFPERWLPASVPGLRGLAPGPLPWRTIGLLAALAMLLAALATYVGSQRPLPAPFGPAGNGLVAYSNDGDIFTIDPVTGVRRAIVTNPFTDHDPRWSLDGTRVAFLRATGSGDSVVITDADGRHEIVGNTVFNRADADSIAWSPDGRSIAIAGSFEGLRRLAVVDTAHGGVTILDVPYRELEVFWRPGSRQILFYGGSGPTLGLYLVSVDDGAVQRLALSEGDPTSLRPVGWTPDGRRFAFSRAGDGAEQYWTYLVDADTGAEEAFPVGFGHLSNDGTRIAGFNSSNERIWICVIHTDGGPCVRVGEGSDAPAPDHRTALQWSPDDQWLISLPGSGGAPVLLDPDGGSAPRPSWPADGAESWQRTVH